MRNIKTWCFWGLTSWENRVPCHQLRDAMGSFSDPGEPGTSSSKDDKRTASKTYGILMGGWVAPNTKSPRFGVEISGDCKNMQMWKGPISATFWQWIVGWSNLVDGKMCQLLRNLVSCRKSNSKRPKKWVWILFRDPKLMRKLGIWDEFSGTTSS